MQLISWVLIFYVSHMTGTPVAHGGPATVAGFESKQQCETTGKRFMQEVPKIDWYKCVEADQPIALPQTRK